MNLDELKKYVFDKISRPELKKSLNNIFEYCNNIQNLEIETKNGNIAELVTAINSYIDFNLESNEEEMFTIEMSADDSEAFYCITKKENLICFETDLFGDEMGYHPSLSIIS